MTPPAVIVQYLDFIDSHRSLSGLSVLDFGCGTAATRDLVVDRGASYIGVEPSSAARQALASKGIDAVGRLHDLGTTRFDVILMLEAIEHLRGSRPTLLELQTLLSEKGVLFATTPNARGLKARLLGNHWEQVRNPTHLCLYSREALVRLLDSCGLAVVRWMHQVEYPGRVLPRRLLNRAMQALQLDGGLRVLAELRG